MKLFQSRVESLFSKVDNSDEAFEIVTSNPLILYPYKKGAQFFSSNGEQAQYIIDDAMNDDMFDYDCYDGDPMSIAMEW